jgi:hypothetical protein
MAPYRGTIRFNIVAKNDKLHLDGGYQRDNRMTIALVAAAGRRASIAPVRGKISIWVRQRLRLAPESTRKAISASRAF